MNFWYEKLEMIVNTSNNPLYPSTYLPLIRVGLVWLKQNFSKKKLLIKNSLQQHFIITVMQFWQIKFNRKISKTHNTRVTTHLLTENTQKIKCTFLTHTQNAINVDRNTFYSLLWHTRCCKSQLLWHYSHKSHFNLCNLTFF